VLMSGAVLFLLPFVWMFAASLKPADEIFSPGFRLLPDNWAVIENYTTALTQVPLLRYLWNGIVVCAGILILQILIALPAAYCFAKIEFRGKKMAWGLILLALMIPFQATAIPLYVMLY